MGHAGAIISGSSGTAEAKKAALEAKKAGKVRYLGNSVPLPHAQFQLPRSSAFGIRVIQVPYNAVLTKAEETVLRPGPS